MGTAAAPRAPATQSVFGVVTALNGSHLIVLDGAGQHNVAIDAATLFDGVEDPPDYPHVVDHNEQRLQIGATVAVSGRVDSAG